MSAQILTLPEVIQSAAKNKWGWREDWVVKSTDCSSGQHRLHFQHPHGSSQLPVMPVPRGLNPSSDTNNKIKQVPNKPRNIL